jgi:hypothetical protein
VGVPVLAPWPVDAALLAPELVAVKQTLLSNKAYLHLLMNQSGEALLAAQELLACSSMSAQQHYAGSCYAAEALCLMGRPAEAQQQLQAHIHMFMQQQGSSRAIGCPGGTVATQQGHGFGATSDAFGAPAAAVAASASGAAAAGSTKSQDDSCVSCSKGVCGHSGSAAASVGAAGVKPQDQAALLHNLGAVFMLQGDVAEGYRHGAMAAALANEQHLAAQHMGPLLVPAGHMVPGAQQQQQLPSVGLGPTQAGSLFTVGQGF